MKGMLARRGFICACILAAAVTPAYPDNDREAKASGERLHITDRFNIPIKEISGLAQVRGEGEDIEIYAVGDDDYEIGRFRQAPNKDRSIEVRDISNRLSARASGSSQWEAVAADRADSLCVLAETRGDVTCIDRALRKEHSHFALDVSTIGSLERVWQPEPNSRGEGMILMRQGHVLLLKEKKPALIVEFGPAGEAATGFSRDALLQEGEAFSAPDASGKLVALKVWQFDDSLQELARDASEMTVGPDERLYMLSQQSAMLIRLERSLKPEEDKVHASAHWRLPQELETAEGLVIDREMSPWVAIDIAHKNAPNLFRLTPIESD